MSLYDRAVKDMTDIANEEQAEVAGKLAWVGMNEI